MKILRTFTITLIVLSQFAQAGELPEAAKRILDKLAHFEAREMKALEEEVVENKKDVLKSLERSERRIKSEGMRKLFGWHINKLKEEIANSERLISGGETKIIVDFDVVYHYDHPMDEFSEQKGELTFYQNGNVKLVHKNPLGETQFEHVIKWGTRGGDLIIYDHVHGKIIVSQRRPNKSDDLRLKWTRLEKSITARSK
jgi:hypothetical protein